MSALQEEMMLNFLDFIIIPHKSECLYPLCLCVAFVLFWIWDTFISYWCCKVMFRFCYYTNCNNSVVRTRSKLPKVKHQIPDHETKDLKNFRHLSEELKLWFYNDRDVNLVGRGTMYNLLSFCLSFNCIFQIFRWLNQFEAVKIGFIENKIIYYYSHIPGIKSFSLNDNFFRLLHDTWISPLNR